MPLFLASWTKNGSCTTFRTGLVARLRNYPIGPQGPRHRGREPQPTREALLRRSRGASRIQPGETHGYPHSLFLRWSWDRLLHRLARIGRSRQGAQRSPEDSVDRPATWVQPTARPGARTASCPAARQVVARSRNPFSPRESGSREAPLMHGVREKGLVCSNPNCPVVKIPGGAFRCPKCGTKGVPAGREVVTK